MGQQTNHKQHTQTNHIIIFNLSCTTSNSLSDTTMTVTHYCQAATQFYSLNEITHSHTTGWPLVPFFHIIDVTSDSQPLVSLWRWRLWSSGSSEPEWWLRHQSMKSSGDYYHVDCKSINHVMHDKHLCQARFLQTHSHWQIMKWN